MKYSTRSLLELDSVKYFPSGASTRKSVPIPRKFLYDEMYESDTDDGMNLYGEDTSNTIPTTTQFDTDAELDTDVIGQLQIHSKRVWNIK